MFVFVAVDSSYGTSNSTSHNNTMNTKKSHAAKPSYKDATSRLKQRPKDLQYYVTNKGVKVIARPQRPRVEHPIDGARGLVQTVPLSPSCTSLPVDIHKFSFEHAHLYEQLHKNGVHTSSELGDRHHHCSMTSGVDTDGNCSCYEDSEDILTQSDRDRMSAEKLCEELHQSFSHLL